MSMIRASAAPSVRVANANFTSSDLSGGTYVFSHNLGAQYPNIQVSDDNNQKIEPDLITFSDSNTANIDLSSFTLTGTYHAVAIA